MDIDRQQNGAAYSLWGALGVHAASGGYRALTYVCAEQRRLLGLAQAEARDANWHVARLAASSHGILSVDAVLGGLLSELGFAIAQRGGLRLYAHMLANSYPEAFARAGFSVYSHESVYRLEETSTPRASASAAPLRPQQPKDAWAIFQLYSALTPRIVQQAEGLGAADFETPGPTTVRSLPVVGERRWVLDVDGDILGYMRVTRLPRRLYLLIHPDAYRHTPALIAAGVADLAPRRRVYCAVPEHQGGLGVFLEQAGFSYVAGQDALVKHLVVLERGEKRVQKAVLERKLEPAHTVSGHH